MNSFERSKYVTSNVAARGLTTLLPNPTLFKFRERSVKKEEARRIQCGSEVPERAPAPHEPHKPAPHEPKHPEKKHRTGHRVIKEAAMPQKQRSKSWTELKQAGNECFKTGQYGEATNLYSQAIKELEKSNKKNPEDLGILHSNRAASYLKEGNCSECVKDCNLSLDLFPFNVKSLLRRAAAYEALERYRLAYVDYKTALLIDCNIAAAHEGTNRMTKALTEADGLSWREKLPPIPTISLSDREKLAQKSPAAQPNPTPKHNGTRQTNKPTPSDKDMKKGQTLKEEGNALVKKGEHKKAIEKYSQSLKHNPTEITTYTNRALCYLSVKQYRDAVRDCDEALAMDGSNIKALYRRAQALLELKDIKGCEDNLNTLLQVEPKNVAALKMMEDAQNMK